MVEDRFGTLQIPQTAWCPVLSRIAGHNEFSVLGKV